MFSHHYFHACSDNAMSIESGYIIEQLISFDGNTFHYMLLAMTSVPLGNLVDSLGIISSVILFTDSVCSKW